MKVTKIASFISLSFLLLTASCGNNTVNDNFNDNSTNPSLWTAYYSSSGPTIAETNQRLECAFPANFSWDSFMAMYASTCQLSGDFDIQVDYSLIDWPAQNGVRFGLGVEPAPVRGGIETRWVERVSFAINDFSGWPREVYLTHFSDSVQGITATSNLSGKLRLVRTSNTLSGYYFSNGSWILVHSGPVTDADVHILIAAWSDESIFADQEVKIAFDNFVINQGHWIIKSE